MIANLEMFMNIITRNNIARSERGGTEAIPHADVREDARERIEEKLRVASSRSSSSLSFVDEALRAR